MKEMSRARAYEAVSRMHPYAAEVAELVVDPDGAEVSHCAAGTAANDGYIPLPFSRVLHVFSQRRAAWGRTRRDGAQQAAGTGQEDGEPDEDFADVVRVAAVPPQALLNPLAAVRSRLLEPPPAHTRTERGRAAVRVSPRTQDEGACGGGGLLLVVGGRFDVVADREQHPPEVVHPPKVRLRLGRRHGKQQHRQQRDQHPDAL